MSDAPRKKVRVVLTSRKAGDDPAVLAKLVNEIDSEQVDAFVPGESDSPTAHHVEVAERLEAHVEAALEEQAKAHEKLPARVEPEVAKRNLMRTLGYLASNLYGFSLRIVLDWTLDKIKRGGGTPPSAQA